MGSPRYRIQKLQRRRRGGPLVEQHGARRVATPDRVIGCRREEGIDDERPHRPGRACCVGVDR